MDEKHLSGGRLTARYAVLQASYWVINCAMFGFAAVYLEDRGFGAGTVGVILALATIFSGLLQPWVAAVADRAKRVSLQTLLVALAVLGALPLVLMRCLHQDGQMVGVLFLLGALVIDLIQPLMNALSVYYVERGVGLNFSIGRGVGSLGFASASAFLGWLIARRGGNAMLVTCLIAYAVLILMVLTFPVLRRTASAASEEPLQRSSTLLEFFRRYRRFCLSLVGIFFLACFHLMTEHYLYQMMLRVGGTEQDMGFNLSMATLVEVPAIMLFSKLGPKAKTEIWLRLSAVSFLLKALCFALAPTVWLLHLAQIFQATSFGIYAPASVRYATEQIAREDMVKGQAVVAAFYTFGGSLGNFLGGQLIEFQGTASMLWTGVVSAAMGAVIVWLTVCRSLASKEISAKCP